MDSTLANPLLNGQRNHAGPEHYWSSTSATDPTVSAPPPARFDIERIMDPCTAPRHEDLHLFTEAATHELALRQQDLQPIVELRNAAHKMHNAEFKKGCWFCPCTAAAKEKDKDFAENVKPHDQRWSKQMTAIDLTKTLLTKIQSSTTVETRSKWQHGIAVAYNDNTGQLEWKEGKWEHGIDGVFNKHTGAVEWRDADWQHDIAGVWNPVTQSVEWKQSAWQNGVGGCWNPKLRRVEWREKWQDGVCGVWNPVKEIVEWNEKWENGVAGYWDPSASEVKWVSKWQDGVALAVPNPYGPGWPPYVCSKGWVYYDSK